MDDCEIKKIGNLEFRCYFQLALMVVGGKWKPKVLFYLSQDKAVRFSEMRRMIFGISEKMLIQSLKELEKDGMVKRKVYRQVPPKVEYSLTELGKSLVPVLESLHTWGQTYASYMAAKKEKRKDYVTGEILQDLDELVSKK